MTIVKLFAKLTLILGIVFVGTPIAYSAVILDQSHIDTRSSSGCFTPGDCIWQQEVVAGITGKLDSVEILLSGSATTSISLFDGSPVNLGTSAYQSSTSYSVSEYDLVLFDLSALNYMVTAGQSFTMSLQKLSGTGRIGLTNNSGYAGDLGLHRPGELLTDCYNNCQYDMIFNTYVDAQVPEPSIFSLMGVGLLGLSFARRRKQKA